VRKLVLKVVIGSQCTQEVETNIEIPSEGTYYIPNDYKEPETVRLVDYKVCNGVENEIVIMAIISYKSKLKDISPKLLFKTKGQASNYYLENKDSLHFEYLKD